MGVESTGAEERALGSLGVHGEEVILTGEVAEGGSRGLGKVVSDGKNCRGESGQYDQ